MIGCRKYEFNTALIGIPKAQDLFRSTKNIDFVVVAEDGTVFPKELLIANDTYAIVWVGQGTKLELEFANPQIKPVCDPHMPMICVAGPLHLPPGYYPYKGKITDKGGTKSELDPHLEVVR